MTHTPASAASAVDTGTPSAAAIFLLPKRRVLHGETLLCGSHHVVVRMPENTWDIEGNCGLWSVDLSSSRSRASVCNVGKT